MLVKEAETNQKNLPESAIPLLRFLKSEHGGSVDSRTRPLQAASSASSPAARGAGSRWRRSSGRCLKCLTFTWVGTKLQRCDSPAAAPLSFCLLSERDLFEQPALDTSSVFFMWCNERQHSHDDGCFIIIFFYTGFNKRRRKNNKTNIYINISHTVKSKPCFPVGLCVTFEK